jgi:hypothetical protein
MAKKKLEKTKEQDKSKKYWQKQNGRYNSRKN